MNNKKSGKSKGDIAKIVLICVLGILLALITIWIFPYIVSLKDEQVRETFKNYIHAKGIIGVLILLAMQVVQVVIAVIPGEVVEVVSGILYGTIGGYLICTVGMLIGTITIYYLVKLLGASFAKKMVDGEKLAKYKFLHNAKKLEIITFILFFIPGTPKDLLTYVMPFTPIKPFRLFIIIAVARIPSIISSTFAGSSLGQGRIGQSLIVFIIIGIVGILGIIFNEKLIAFFNKEKAKLFTDKTKK
ncbi:MAG: VTT domain-containing protein [Oscillospiraceae bacterium]